MGKEVMRMKGQLGIEYVVLLSISITLFIAVVYVANDQIVSLSRQQGLNNAKNSLKLIADSAAAVYAEGSGAKRVISVSFPDGVDAGSPQIINNTVTLKYYGSDVSYTLGFPISGSLPSSSGVYEIALVSEGGSVTAGTVPFSVSPTSLSYSFCSSNSSQFQSLVLGFLGERNETISVTITQNWSAPGVGLNVSPTFFTLAAEELQNVTVNVTVGPSTIGTFSGSLTAATENYSTVIPIIATVSSCGGPTPLVSSLRITTFKNASYATEKQAFTPAENVTIIGGNWSPLSTVTLDIRNPSNASVSGYPKDVPTNATGGFTDSLAPGGLTSGLYTSIANQTVTVKSTTFTLRGC
jgi:uncharacterized protein (UPF0333 family)